MRPHRMSCSCGYAFNAPTARSCKLCGKPWPPRIAGEEPPQGRAPRTVRQRQHLLVPKAGDPIQLEPGVDLTLGRSSSCGLTVPSRRVSRKHAIVFWRSEFPVILNLSTTNGTVVNGSEISEHELRDRDEIVIGPYRCTYRALRPGRKLTDRMAPMDQTTLKTGPAIAGSLVRLNLFELLGAFEHQEKTGTLELRHKDEHGRIVLDQGRFVSAETGDLEGEEAVLALLAWREGAFCFSPDVAASPLKIIRKFDDGSAGQKKSEGWKQMPITAFLARAVAEHPGLVDTDPDDADTA